MFYLFTAGMFIATLLLMSLPVIAGIAGHIQDPDMPKSVFS